jgi:nucleobase transporter 1/2
MASEASEEKTPQETQPQQPVHKKLRNFEEWRREAAKGPKKWMIYGTEDRPESIIEAAFLGLQQYFIMFGATVAVPILVAGWIAQYYQIPDNTMRLLIIDLITIQFLGAGITTLLQTWHKTGSGLPIVQGSSFSFLGSLFAVISSTAIIAQSEGYPDVKAFIAAVPDPWVRASIVLRYTTGAIIAASFFEIILGYSMLMGKIKRWITPVSIGPTIIIIGLSLFGAPSAMHTAEGWWEALLVVFFIILFNQFIGRKYIRVQMFSVLLSIVTVWVIAAILTAGGLLKGVTAVNFWPIEEVVKTNYYFRPPWIFPWGPPKFVAAFALGMIAAYLASMVESIGDYHSVARMSEAPPPTEDMISKGLGAEGLGCLIGGIFGAAGGYTSYSENIGAIGLTRVASRYVFQLGGALILFLGGMITAWGAFMATMPNPIIGGLYLSVFGLIAAIGVSVVSMANMKSSRNLYIIGLAMFAGLAVPPMAQSQAMNAWVASLGPWAWLGQILQVFLETGMADAAIVGIILDNLLPGTPEERGMLHPDWA